MSIIQSIRDKAAPVVIIVIAVSLIGFILMDAGRSGLGKNTSPKDAIGVVNGTNISYESFMDKIKTTEQIYEMNGRTVDENTRQQIYSDTWRSMIETELLNQEYAKLGIVISDKEYNDLLFGKNPPEFLKQQFTNPNTGEYDVVAAKQAISQLKKNQNNPNRELVNKFYLDPLIESTMRTKYFSLLQNSAYVPKWLAEKTIADNGLISSFSYVMAPYSSVADSTVKVTDEAIMDYVKAHKDEYQQEEKTRNIAYVTFPFTPTGADTAEVLKQLLALKEEFKTTNDPGAFVTRSGTTLPFYDGYYSKDRIQIPNKDSIINKGVGGVYGPYIDVNSYVLSRVVDTKVLPDSVKARHILVGTFDPRTQKPTMDEASAKKKIDSIQALVKSGVSFDSLAMKLSDDEGSRIKGGDLGYFAGGTMVKEFNDFCFQGKKGDMGVVKTQFGYHLIQIEDQKNFSPSYKIAYLAKPIEASQSTINDASNKANLFAGNSRDLKAYNDNITKNGYNKLVAQDLKENDFMVPTLGVNRSLVRDIFKADIGKVLEPIEMNDQFVVVAVTGEDEKGLPTAAKVRPMVESIVRNEMKAKQLKEKFAGANTLEVAAQKTGQAIQKADSVSFVSPLLPGAGYELKVGGFAFNKAGLNKVSSPISGSNGVYVIRPEAISAKADPLSNAVEMQKNLANQQKGTVAYSALDALRKAADVSDKRSKFL